MPMNGHPMVMVTRDTSAWWHVTSQRAWRCWHVTREHRATWHLTDGEHGGQGAVLHEVPPRPEAELGLGSLEDLLLEAAVEHAGCGAGAGLARPVGNGGGGCGSAADSATGELSIQGPRMILLMIFSRDYRRKSFTSDWFIPHFNIKSKYPIYI